MYSFFDYQNFSVKRWFRTTSGSSIVDIVRVLFSVSFFIRQRFLKGILVQAAPLMTGSCIAWFFSMNRYVPGLFLIQVVSFFTLSGFQVGTNVRYRLYLWSTFEPEYLTQRRLQDTLGYSSFRKWRKTTHFVPNNYHKYLDRLTHQQVCTPNDWKMTVFDRDFSKK